MRFADELNLDGLAPTEVAAAIPTIRARCEEIDRDPATLRLSVHIATGDSREAGSRRVDRLAAYRELGVARIQTLLRDSPLDREAVASFAADCRAAGATLETPTVL